MTLDAQAWQQQKDVILLAYAGRVRTTGIGIHLLQLFSHALLSGSLFYERQSTAI